MKQRIHLAVPFLFFATCLIETAAFADLTTPQVRLWDQLEDLGGADQARAIGVDADGNVVVAGVVDQSGPNQHFRTIKYAAATGTEIWNIDYNPNGGPDRANALAVFPNGDVVVTGFTSRDGNNVNRNFYTVRYAGGTGEVIWDHSYHDAGKALFNEAEAVVIDGNGDVIVTGHADSNNGEEQNRDFMTVKINGTTGVLVWSRLFDGGSAVLDQKNDAAFAIAVDSTNNVIVAGTSQVAGQGSDFCTVKYSAAGVYQWDIKKDGPGHSWDEAKTVAVDNDGNVIVSGHLDTNGPGAADRNLDWYTAKYGPTGTFLWGKSPTSTVGDDKVLDMALDAAGNAFVVGYASDARLGGSEHGATGGSSSMHPQMARSCGAMPRPTQRGRRGRVESWWMRTGMSRSRAGSMNRTPRATRPPMLLRRVICCGATSLMRPASTIALMPLPWTRQAMCR